MEEIVNKSITAKKVMTCSHCDGKIQTGERCRIGVYADADDVKTLDIICADCFSVRSVLFCGYPVGGGTWELVEDSLLDDMDGKTENEIISKLHLLTPAAKDRVIRTIDTIWEECAE